MYGCGVKLQDVLLRERSRAENSVYAMCMHESWVVLFSRDFPRGMQESSAERELGSWGRGGQWWGACCSLSALSAV